MAWIGQHLLGARLLAGATLLSLFAAFAASDAESPKASSHFAVLDDMRIHYTNYGRGQFALVLVHGWNCDESVWRQQAPVLATRTRVITIDLPGHGQSDKRAPAYTMNLHARAIDAVLDEIDVSSVVLVGHSNGTPVVRQFYRLFPAKVKGLVIVDGALRPFGDAATMEKFIAPLRGRDYEVTAGRFINAMTAPMKDAGEREKIKAMMMSTPQHVAVSEMEALLDPALWTEDKINVPVLMILAKQPAWTPEYETFVRTLVSDLDYQTWDGVSHFLMLEQPNKFNQAILEFLRKHQLLKK